MNEQISVFLFCAHFCELFTLLVHFARLALLALLTLLDLLVRTTKLLLYRYLAKFELLTLLVAHLLRMHLVNAALLHLDADRLVCGAHNVGRLRLLLRHALGLRNQSRDV